MELITMEDYAATIQRLRDDHPWLAESIVRPAPGHLQLLQRLLAYIEEIRGSAGTKSRREHFFRVDAGDRMRECNVYVEFPGLSAARSRAIQDCADRFALDARLHCAACGEAFSEGSRYRQLCQEHAEHNSVFRDGQTEAEPTEPPADIFAEAERKDEEVSAEDIMAAFRASGLLDQPAQEQEDETLPEAAESRPVLQVYDPAGIEKLADAANFCNDKPSRQRYETLLKALRTTPSQRPLGTLPQGWAASLRELQENFPNFAEALASVGDYCTLAEKSDGAVYLPPMLLAGPAGVGKTEMVMSLAEMLGLPSHRIDMASAQCGSELSGSDSFWSNSRHGKLFDAIAFGAKANPVFILEELDKSSGSHHHDPMGPLYNLLEPRTAAAFNDLSLKEITLDASRVIWFSSANDLDRIDTPILSRFNVFEIAAPSREQAAQIARSIYRRVRGNHPWGTLFEPDLSEEVSSYLAGFTPREVRRHLLRACACAARDERHVLLPRDFPLLARGGAGRRGIGFIAA